jgi:hypothetical protein
MGSAVGISRCTKKAQYVQRQRLPHSQWRLYCRVSFFLQQQGAYTCRIQAQTTAQIQIQQVTLHTSVTPIATTSNPCYNLDQAASNEIRLPSMIA